MANVPKTLIVGGGIGGMAAAIRLAQHGFAVDLIEADQGWRVYGAGITITGPTLRAFKSLGILADVEQEGYFSDSIRIFSVDGTPLMEMPSLALEAGIPATGGILRPVLHNILSRRVKAMDIDVSLGVTIATVHTYPDHADVCFSDGRTGRYDLVVGADGIHSKLREHLFPAAPQPNFTGQGCWRILAHRPPAVDRAEIYLGGRTKAGVTPVSRDQMYMFLLEPVPGDTWITPDMYVPRLQSAMAEYGGSIAPLLDILKDDTASINYRPLETLLLPSPWYKDCVVLIGDAAHATTPHLASGAGMAIEDGLVLGDLMLHEPDVPTALASFMARRYERCRAVVDGSVRLGRMELEQSVPMEQQEVFATVIDLLRKPI